MRRIFETALEKVGRIIASQYDLQVVFEGTQAMTDGKTIYLPSCADLTPELMADMNGFLDHEVAHCRYTEFDQLDHLIKGRGGRFHKELLNAVEDGRIEREMVADYPGCRFNLDPLNQKLRGKLKETWEKLPWPVRLICTVRDVMDDEPDAAVDDKEIAPFLELCEPEIARINSCKTTTELRVLTAEMTTKILAHLDEEVESKLGEGDMKGKPAEKGKGEKGKPQKGKGEKGAGGKKEKGEVGDGESGEGSGESGEGEGEGERGGDAGGTGDQMMDEGAGREADADKKGGSEWNEHDLSVDDMVRRDLKAHFGEETPTKRDVPRASVPEERGVGGHHDTDRSKLNKKHVPFTTRFDKERDFTGEGKVDVYRRLRAEVQKYVGPIKRILERKLKVEEQRKWRGERERGGIDPRSLARLATDKSFVKPFREQARKDTNNVAVQILIDQSGSMGGGSPMRKIEVAKMTAIALAEALNELKIPCEVTGFYSVGDAAMGNAYRSTPSAAGRTGLYNRWSERLELHVFKRFDSFDLTGIEKVSVGGNNTDGESVRWAANRLSLQKQKRKILIVLSDGEPASEGDARILRNDLAVTVKKILKTGIEVIGIGIQTRTVQEFYPDNLVVNRLEELPGAAMGKLAKLLGG